MHDRVSYLADVQYWYLSTLNFLLYRYGCCPMCRQLSVSWVRSRFVVEILMVLLVLRYLGELEMGQIRHHDFFHLNFHRLLFPYRLADFYRHLNHCQIHQLSLLKKLNYYCYYYYYFLLFVILKN